MSNRSICPMGADFETREEGGQLVICGYFAKYGTRYPLWENAWETIDPGAFDGHVSGDIRALTNHDTTLVLGRTTAGTLSLRLDDIGLYGVIIINPHDQDAKNLYERVKRGDVSQCSFGFEILREELEHRDDGSTVWHLKEVKLFEVTVATFPAYEDTNVEARKAELATIRNRQLEQTRAALLARLKGE